MATKKATPAGGGVSGKRDPLTLGEVTHGEDIKGNSTRVAKPKAPAKAKK